MDLLNILLMAPQVGAEGAKEGNGGMFQMILMIVMMGVVFYFFMIRPQRQQQKKQQEFIDSLQPGSKVMTVGGIHGTVTQVTDNTVVVRIAENVDIAVEKRCVIAADEPQEQDKNKQIEEVK